jgi:outer membrane immunogenic protein
MKKLSVFKTALVGFVVTGPALAADLPNYRPPIVEVAPFSWSGFYVGGNVGYDWRKDDLSVNGFNVNGVSIPGTAGASLALAGFLGGVQAGYNWQVTPSWVLGLETDFQWPSRKNSVNGSGAVTSTSCFGDPNPACNLSGTGTGNVAPTIDWFGTVRGRLGFSADKSLFYGTGGLAYGQIKTLGAASFNGTFTDNSGGTCDAGGAGCPASGSAAFSDNKTKLGWTAGAGMERSVGSGSNWTWRVEYLYVDFGTSAASVPYNSSVSVLGKPLVQTVNGASSYAGHVTDQIIRFGTNYKFGG